MTTNQSTGHYHDPEGKYDYCLDPRCPRTTRGLYSRREIGRMTTNALDELLEYYQDTENDEGVWRVEQELAERDLEAELPGHDDTPSLADEGIELGSYAS